ncbi:MAG: hypothetical protein J4F46_08100 [Dehalococcoidia bacterium]|nr:hypothetical protein [Dehalococcoidia bacterium]
MSVKPFYVGGALLCFAVLTVLACSGGEPTPGAEPSDELSIGVGSTDLGVGPNRLSFFLLDSDSTPVMVDRADVCTYHPASSYPEGEPKEVAVARFRKWALGDMGVYTTQLTFDNPGEWALMVSVVGVDGESRSAEETFHVKQESSTPAIGSPALPSKNKTSRDVRALEELTTAIEPDPELYSITVAEALDSGKPLVVAFATPAFCRTATCGPQVAAIQSVKDKYKDRVDFIHIEVFDNVEEIRREGDLSVARTVDAVVEWGLLTEPWTFIVDRQGRIAAKFEAFTTEEEIEEELTKVLQ